MELSDINDLNRTIDKINEEKRQEIINQKNKNNK